MLIYGNMPFKWDVTFFFYFIDFFMWSRRLTSSWTNWLDVVFVSYEYLQHHRSCLCSASLWECYLLVFWRTPCQTSRETLHTDGAHYTSCRFEVGKNVMSVWSCGFHIIYLLFIFIFSNINHHRCIFLGLIGGQWCYKIARHGKLWGSICPERDNIG